MLRRVLLGFVGGLLVLVAGVAGAAAGWGHLTFANGGSLRFDLGTVVPGATDTAVVLDIDRFGASIPYLDAIGHSQLAVRSAQPDGTDVVVFVGAADTAAADAFVKGTPYAVGLRDESGWQVRQIPGSAPLPDPASAPWLAQVTGNVALLEVPTARPLTVVVARPDGAPVGAVAIAADFAVAQASQWAMWVGIGAGVLLIVGVVLLVLAFRRRRPRGAHAAGTAVAESVFAAPAAAAEPVVVAEPVVGETVTDETVAVEPVVVAEAVPAPADETVVVAPVLPAADETAELPVVAEPVPEPAADEPAPEPAAEPVVVPEPETEPDEHQPT